MTSFITELEADAGTIEQDVVAGLKTAVSYVDNVIVTDLEPVALAAIKTALTTFGATMFADILGLLTPGATITVPTPTTPAAS